MSSLASETFTVAPDANAPGTKRNPPPPSGSTASVRAAASMSAGSKTGYVVPPIRKLSA
jgi:hypothetical protein